MNPTEPEINPVSLKKQIRDQAHANRRAQPDKDEVSRAIMERFMSLDEFGKARTVMFYVDVRDEVRTRFDLANALQSGKRIVVPYCQDQSLALFQIEDIDELEPGRYGVLEPRHDLRSLSRRQVNLVELDLLMVPGVAFDPQGGRLGHGKGYFDRLLEHAVSSSVLVGVAFNCQVFSEIPMQPHDIAMDKVVTETTVYRGRGRS